MPGLTKRQKQIYDFITGFIAKNDISPTLEEIKKNFKLSALSAVHEHIGALVKKGFLIKNNNSARGLELNKELGDVMVQIPLLGMIAAGAPIEAITIPEAINVPKSFLSRGGKHYALRVTGQSMIDDGIFDGDTVIIRKQDIVDNGETAVALINGNEATLKRIYTERGKFRLQPANPKMKPFFVKRLTIQGKVVGVMRSMA